jgi:hypothetical protein
MTMNETTSKYNHPKSPVNTVNRTWHVVERLGSNRAEDDERGNDGRRDDQHAPSFFSSI